MSFEQGYALLIGVGRYAHHKRLSLPITVADAQEVKQVLLDPARCGYPEGQVRLLHDAGASTPGIIDALDQLAEQLRPEHTLVIFYAGHGMYGTDGLYYLTAHDTQLSEHKVVPETGICEAVLLEKLRGIKAGRLLLLFNACHAGEIGPSSLGGEPAEKIDSPSLPERTADALLSTGEGRIIMTACRATQRTSTGRGNLTPFGQALVDGLSGRGTVASNHGFISAYSLYEHVYESVKKTVQDLGYLQEPELTVLKGVGPFAVALYRGAVDQGVFDRSDALPSRAAVRQVDMEQSRSSYVQITQNYIQIYKPNILVIGTQNNYYGTSPAPETPAGITPRPWQAEDERLLQRYLERASQDYRTLKFRGVLVRGRHVETPELEHTFITIRMEAEAEAKKLPGKTGRTGRMEADQTTEMRQPAETVELAEAIRLTPKLAIIGGAGSGKSTLLQWAGLAAAKQLLPNQTLSEEQAAFVQALGEQPLVPILLPLRMFTSYCLDKKDSISASGILHFIHYYLNEKYTRLHLPEDFFSRLLAERGCLVMFDGVDEVDAEQRASVGDAVEAFVKDYQSNPNNRYLVTSRTTAYLGKAQVGGFRRCDVQPLSPAQRNQLIYNWCQAVDGEEEGCKEADDLIKRIDNSDERVQALADTPLMVTIFALVYYKKKELPRQRAELYETAVAWLLTEEYKESETSQQLKEDWETRRQRLQYIAFRMHDSGGKDLLEDDLLELVWGYFGTPEQKRTACELARKFIRKVTERGGLLENQDQHYDFYSHRTFREFLVGRYIADELTPEKVLMAQLRKVLGNSDWLEPVRLAAGYRAIGSDNRPLDFILGLSELGRSAKQRTQALTWAGLCLSDLPPKEDPPPKWIEARKTVSGQMLEQLMADPPLVAPRLRYELGLALGEAGDPRFVPQPAARAKKLNVILPELVKIAAGDFRMGTSADDKKVIEEQGAQSWENEEPDHTVRLSEYWIGKYPLTNAEFRCFYDDHGYDHQGLWSVDGWHWRTGEWQSDLSVYPEEVRKDYERWLARRPKERRGQPFFWDDPRLNGSNLPVVGICWFEAQAYCTWLSKVTGKKYGLPSEAQWEQAARGRQGYIWPWGSVWEAQRCNNFEAKDALNTTSPVGMYPQGMSPYGAMDLAGNVWEWCADWYDSQEYARRKDQAVLDPTGPADGKARVVRGGSWGTDRGYARSACRGGFGPGSFLNGLGFRVVRFPI